MDARARYEELADELAARDPDVALGKVFGYEVVKRYRKVVAALGDDAMIFRLPDPAERERALGLPGAELFKPLGRTMKEWVQVPAAHADEWPALAEAALRSRSRS
jgi:hypothetical protein